MLIYTYINILFWQVKKSIFASPESVNGKVGVGTCGIADKPMTQYNDTSKYNVRHLMPQWPIVLFVHIWSHRLAVSVLSIAFIYIYDLLIRKLCTSLFKILMLFSFVVTMENYMEVFSFIVLIQGYLSSLEEKEVMLKSRLLFNLDSPKPNAQMYRVWIRMCILTTGSLFCCL